jgi:TonB family protein
VVAHWSKTVGKRVLKFPGASAIDHCCIINYMLRLSYLPVAFVILLVGVLAASDSAGQASRVNWATVNQSSSAVDVSGKRFRGSQYKGKPPWIEDILSSPIIYPYEARRFHQSGRVQLHIFLDPGRGTVTNALLAKASGSDVLDSAALSWIRKWKWKPGLWKEVQLPITFEMPPASPTPTPTPTPRIHR